MSGLLTKLDGFQKGNIANLAHGIIKERTTINCQFFHVLTITQTEVTARVNTISRIVFLSIFTRSNLCNPTKKHFSTFAKQLSLTTNDIKFAKALKSNSFTSAPLQQLLAIVSS